MSEAALAKAQTHREGVDSLAGGRPVSGSIGGDNEQRRRAAIGGDGVDEVEGRSVAPMQVLEYQHDRRRHSGGAHRVEQLTQHAISRGTHRPGSQPVGDVGRNEAGQLQHPAGSHLDEAVDGRVPVGGVARIADRAEHGQKGLADAAKLDALADAGEHVGREGFEEL